MRATNNTFLDKLRIDTSFDRLRNLYGRKCSSIVTNGKNLLIAEAALVGWGSRTRVGTSTPPTPHPLRFLSAFPPGST